MPIVAAFVICMALLAGCSGLPRGSMQAVRVHSSLSHRGQVYLIRGWRDLWSAGIDRLTDELRAQGVDAHVFRQSQTDDLGDELLARYRGAGDAEPLVLVGFSYGADDVIDIARRLAAAQVRVDLLITIDPVTPPLVPANVGDCRNYYQSNGLWDVFPWFRGIALGAESPRQRRIVNIDLRHYPDLLEPGTAHSTIAGNAKLHRAIIEQILAICATKAISGGSGH